ncbi:TRAPP trafficking subunit Trs65-domain-containing protein [Xylogone sp. PMI_703]|nr:TRAPP trafficking subunit Trs65-domain-containing protein [Xylogone sp. PMI_703]
MAEPEEDTKPRGSLEFAESSVLDTIVPLASNLNIEEALSNIAERLEDGQDSVLASIPQRQALFFDETVNVYVVLKTPYFDETALRLYLGRLAITLEAQVVNAQPENSDIPPTTEIIYNGSAQDTDPLIIVQGAEEGSEESNGGHIYAVWKMSAFLVRPRLRLQNPSIVFSATANLKPAEQVENGILRREYLQTQVPSGLNLLEAFGDDPALNGVVPRLSALRVSRVTPATQSAIDRMRPLKNISRRSIKVYPAINARVRYSRPNSTPSNLSVMAMLDVDITPFSNCEVTLTEVKMGMMGGTIESLDTVGELPLPMTCRPQDDVTFLYLATPDDMDITNKSAVRRIDISIAAQVNVVPDACQPQISMQWTTSLDFTPPVNPGYGTPAQPIQRAHRPSQLSITSPIDPTPTASNLAITRPDSLPTIELTTRQERLSSVDFGVTMSFTAPPSDQPLYPGIPFAWSVFVVNRSERPRKLAIFAIPKRRRTETRTMRPASTGSHHRKQHDIADAVVDDNIVHAMQRSAAMETTEVVCLSTDTRIGPLAPSACYEVELKFMAMKVGILTLEAIRVVDLGTQEHLDIKDLPVIVVSSPGE